VTLVFLLTYGGGLVGGDKISLDVSLEENTRLVLVTQGSTKIFKSPARSVVSAQTLNVTIAKDASLCYLPDPTQPFSESVYEQRQTFLVDPHGTSSLCVLDWVSEGRRARDQRVSTREKQAVSVAVKRRGDAERRLWRGCPTRRRHR
jgi:urease accessory protein